MYGDDSWDHADADYYACCAEEAHGELEDAATNDGYVCVESWLESEGVLYGADAAGVGVDVVVELFPCLAEQAERECAWEAREAYADAYTRRAEQGFYNG